MVWGDEDVDDNDEDSLVANGGIGFGFDCNGGCDDVEALSSCCLKLESFNLFTLLIGVFSSGGGSVAAFDEFFNKEYSKALIPLPIDPLLLLIRLLYFILKELGGFVVVGVVADVVPGVVAGEVVAVVTDGSILIGSVAELFSVSFIFVVGVVVETEVVTLLLVTSPFKLKSFLFWLIISEFTWFKVFILDKSGKIFKFACGVERCDVRFRSGSVRTADVKLGIGDVTLGEVAIGIGIKIVVVVDELDKAGGVGLEGVVVDAVKINEELVSFIEVEGVEASVDELAFDGQGVELELFNEFEPLAVFVVFVLDIIVDSNGLTLFVFVAEILELLLELVWLFIGIAVRVVDEPDVCINDGITIKSNIIPLKNEKKKLGKFCFTNLKFQLFLF